MRDLVAAAHLRVLADAVLALWPELRNVAATGMQAEAAPDPRKASGSAADIDKMESIGTASLAEPVDARHKRANTPPSDRAGYSEIKDAVKDAGQKLQSEGLSITELDLWAKVRQALPGKKVPRHLFRDAWGEVFGRRERGRPKSLKKIAG